MSDYLDNLVSRTFNQTPAVKPRLASRYEPLSVVASDREMSMFDIELTPEEQLKKREPLQSTSSGAQLNSRLPELPEPRVSHSLDQEPGLDVEESRLIPAREPNVTVEPLPGLIHEPLPKLIKPASIAAVDSQDVRPIQPPNAGVRQLTRKVQKPAPPITSSINEPDQTLASDSRLKGTLTPKPRPDLLDNRDISTGTAPTRLISTEPKGHQSLEIISHQNSVAEPSTEGEGKISVTIGRVDVRAIFAQPRVDRSERPRKSTAMSLDDYLKQRTGGRQ